MPRFVVAVAYTYKRQPSTKNLSIHASDTMSARDKAKETLQKWQGVENIQIKACVLDG